MKLLHIAYGNMPDMRMMSPVMTEELEKLGELEIVTRGRDMTEEERAGLIRNCDILLTGWGSSRVPDSIAADRGRLGYICNITGEMRSYVNPCHIESGVSVTNWGDAISREVAEGAVALFFAVLKGIRPLGKLVEAGF